ncbi:coiled-coil-helix-coiled-coil-helix domain containing 2 [Brevipalpus obovatus]|uniref:coiled-coil-helix-coiled-coil-helix domain containing 2 n=1 Tax=Brevipalpus obovatus TaxID=246614 RepID=UPI003D9F14B8
MARRGGRGASPSRRTPMQARPRQAPVQTKAPAPVPQQPTAVGQPMAQGPGLLGQMAATAGGVAIGSAVGHTVGHALTGAFSGGNSDVPAQQEVQAQPQQSMQRNQEAPCTYEMRQFFNCTQEQSDISLCEGFNQVLKDCRMRYGSQPQQF